MRIIAGTLKGRRLKSPSWDGLRPTSDRLRETLFNILARTVAGRGFSATITYMNWSPAGIPSAHVCPPASASSCIRERARRSSKTRGS